MEKEKFIEDLTENQKEAYKIIDNEIEAIEILDKSDELSFDVSKRNAALKIGDLLDYSEIREGLLIREVEE